MADATSATDFESRMAAIEARAELRAVVTMRTNEGIAEADGVKQASIQAAKTAGMN